MTAGIYDITKDSTCEQGATFERSIIIENTDLTGYSAKMQVKTGDCQDECNELIIELSTTNGRIIFTENLGEMKLFISAEDTADLQCGIYRYDLLLIYNDKIYRELEGQFQVKGGITK